MTHDEAAQQVLTSGTIQEISTIIFCVPRVPAVCFVVTSNTTAAFGGRHLTFTARR